MQSPDKSAWRKVYAARPACPAPRTEIEQAFQEIKQDVSIRPVYHQNDGRIEAHIFVSFLSYCLQVTLKQRAKDRAPGLTPRAILGSRRYR